MHIEEISYFSDSTFYYEKLRHLEWPVYLDSCYQKDKPQSDIARYDIIAANPFIKCQTKGNKVLISKNGKDEIVLGNSLNIIQEIMGSFDYSDHELPFVGGAIGYFSYELNANSKKKSLIPTMMVGVYDWAVVVDHFKTKAFLVSPMFNSETKSNWLDIIQLFNQQAVSKTGSFKITSDISDNTSFDKYKKKFNKITSYFKKGDCYQVNISKKYQVKTSGDSWYFYKKFREINKSPFMAYLQYDNFEILSGSPERFIKSRDYCLETRPIKGTRARGLDERGDKKNIDDLLNSAKDKAENLMIVDLLRNDLSVNAEVGTVAVKQLFSIESYPNVHHLVSTITAKLNNKTSLFKVFKDAFPGGSVTGAPKIRAMEVIDELEEHSRDLYCGGIAYFGYHNVMDSNVAIRSMIHYDHTLHFYSGGGLTIQSNLEAEYQEIEDKVENIKKTINFFKD